MPPLIDSPAALAAYALGVAEQRLNPPAGYLVALVGDRETVVTMAAVALPDGGDNVDGWVTRSVPGIAEATASITEPIVFLVAFTDAPRIDFVETLNALSTLCDEVEHRMIRVHEALVVESVERTWTSILTGDDPAPIPDLPDLPPARDVDQLPTVDDDDPTLTPRIPAQETQP